jgi:hypothetical protein
MSYSPTLRRWLEQDPAGYVDGLSLYQYVSSSPVNLVDPLGLAPKYPLDFGRGYKGRADIMNRGGGRFGGHIHVVHSRLGEVAHVSENGGYDRDHGGRPMGPANRIPPDVRKNIRREVGNFQRKLRQMNGGGNIALMLVGLAFATSEIVDGYQTGGVMGGLGAAGSVGSGIAIGTVQSTVVGGAILGGAELAGTSVVGIGGATITGVGGAAAVGGAVTGVAVGGFALGTAISEIPVGGDQNVADVLAGWVGALIYD